LLSEFARKRESERGRESERAGERERVRDYGVAICVYDMSHVMLVVALKDSPATCICDTTHLMFEILFTNLRMQP